MFKIAGLPDKKTSEIKEKFQLLIEDLIAFLDVNEYTIISVL